MTTGYAPALERPTDPATRRRGGPLLAAVALLLAYLTLSTLIGPHGYIGGDTGGKVATLQAMEASGRIDADVGYWAEAWDPEGRLHPLYSTVRVDGRWVNVATLPALLAAYPLFRIGGFHGALVLPMVGAVLAALAARALSRRLTRDSPSQGAAGAAAFWTVGLASPVAVYALDFSEHTLGMALVGWAVLHLLVLVDDPGGGRPWRAVVAGLLLGTAATLRTEALVYAAVAAAVAGGVLLARRRGLGRIAVAGIGLLAGIAIPLVANAVLEQVVLGGGLRAGRAMGAVQTAGGDPARQRIEEAALTLLAIRPTFSVGTYLTGAVVALLVVVAARTRDRRVAAVAVAGAGLLYVSRFAGGLGFVPGLLAATPLAALGLLAGEGAGRARAVTAVAVLALPLVWSVQYLGGMQAQWAGRYLLPSGLLLGAVAATALPSLRRPLAAALVALAAGVTAAGIGWTAVRTHDVASAAAAVASRPEPVLVSRLPYLGREAGWYATGERWLTATTEEDLARAGQIVVAAGFDRFGLVERADAEARPAAVPAGFKATSSALVDWIGGTRLRVTTVVRAS